jgi:Fe-S cluster assembly iron-binding protein IscA
MALDEPRDNDLTFIDQGITFAIEKKVFDEVRPIRIDYVESPTGSGFQLKSSLPSSGCCS